MINDTTTGKLKTGQSKHKTKFKNMRKIIVLSMISLDGVMQAPGGPEEDTSGNFQYGGWVAPYGDEEYGKAVQKHMEPADLLLGRKTFDIFETRFSKSVALKNCSFLTRFQSNVGDWLVGV